MKKKIIFLITLCAIFLGINKNVYAEESRFYESEYVPNIWMNRILSTRPNTIYYQTARFFRQSQTGKVSYCIQPTKPFDENAIYTKVDIPNNLSQEQMNRINALAYYGYNYKNHSDKKWYAITQLLIWKTADPLGDYYFTDTLSGNRIERFTSEINELNSMVQKQNIKPNFSQKKFIIREGETLKVVDSNNALSNYETSLGRIENNNIIFENLKEGNYHIIIKNKNYNNYQYPVTYYQSDTSQNMLITGNIPDETYIDIEVIKTKINITKIDKDTKESTPQGYASLKDTTYKLYNENNEEIKTIIIDENGKGSVENLDFGTYYLKETKPGKGYNLDESKYKITISSDNPQVSLTLENEIIKKEIIIHKVYGNNNEFYPEENVIFEIYDKNKNLIDTIKTDKNGHAKTTLIYGEYTIKQINTKEGYAKIENKNIIVDNNNREIYELTDYKINVPNTYINYSPMHKIIDFILEYINMCIC